MSDGKDKKKPGLPPLAMRQHHHFIYSQGSGSGGDGSTNTSSPSNASRGTPYSTPSKQPLGTPGQQPQQQQQYHPYNGQQAQSPQFQMPPMASTPGGAAATTPGSGGAYGGHPQQQAYHGVQQQQQQQNPAYASPAGSFSSSMSSMTADAQNAPPPLQQPPPPIQAPASGGGAGYVMPDSPKRSPNSYAKRPGPINTGQPDPAPAAGAYGMVPPEGFIASGNAPPHPPVVASSPGEGASTYGSFHSSQGSEGYAGAGSGHFGAPQSSYGPASGGHVQPPVNTQQPSPAATAHARPVAGIPPRATSVGSSTDSHNDPQVMGAPGATSGASAAGAAPPPMQLGWQMPSPGPVASSAPATRTASGRAQPHYFIPDGGSTSNSSNENKQQEQQQQVAHAPSGGKGAAGTGAGPSEGTSAQVAGSRPGSSVTKGGLPNFTTNNPLAGVLPHPEGHREGNKGSPHSPPVAPGSFGSGTGEASAFERRSPPSKPHSGQGFALPQGSGAMPPSRMPAAAPPAHDARARANNDGRGGGIFGGARWMWRNR